jgi:hypothetical protein
MLGVDAQQWQTAGGCQVAFQPLSAQIELFKEATP